MIGRAGNTYKLIKDSVGYAGQLFKTYGPVVSLASGGGTNIYSPLPDCPGTVLTYGPDCIQQVTTQHEVYHKYPLTLMLYPLGDVPPRKRPLKHLGVGLFGVNDDAHREHRRLLMPAFHKKRIETYRDDMVAITQAMLDSWQVGEARDIAEEMQGLTMRIAVKTLFGEDFSEHDEGIGQLLEDSLGSLASPLVILLPFDLPGLPYHRFLDMAAQVETALKERIAKKRAMGARGSDVLSMLIGARDEETGATLSEDELIGHVGVIFAAGHDTSANALTWTLFLLSQHPRVAADLHDELKEVLHGDAPTVAQLRQLPLLERVVKESMRVLPPVPWNGRVTSQPTELGDYALPQGTEVFASIYHTHHMPELYEKPEAFNPERWETIKPSAFAYNPFSAGPRMCIGATFAMMEIKIVLAMLLQRYRLRCLPNRVDRAGLVVMTPKAGMPMIVCEQDENFSQGVGGISGTVREMVALAG